MASRTSDTCIQVMLLIVKPLVWSFMWLYISLFEWIAQGHFPKKLLVKYLCIWKKIQFYPTFLWKIFSSKGNEDKYQSLLESCQNWLKYLALYKWTPIMTVSQISYIMTILTIVISVRRTRDGGGPRYTHISHPILSTTRTLHSLMTWQWGTLVDGKFRYCPHNGTYIIIVNRLPSSLSKYMWYNTYYETVPIFVISVSSYSSYLSSSRMYPVSVSMYQATNWCQTNKFSKF